jgi:uncharacterized protein with von Willebrand factor type A (vWA) domain
MDVAVGLFQQAEARLSALERLPRALWLGGMTNAVGDLPERLEALLGWRESLYEGRLPGQPASQWPGGRVAAGLLACIDSLGLLCYCRGSETIVDMLLQSLLFHCDFVVDYHDRGATPMEAEDMVVAAFAADWQARRGAMDTLIEVLGNADELLKHCRWDTLQGLLRSSEWEDVVRIRGLIERLPELVAIIRRLGRARDAEQSVDDASSLPVREPGAAGVAVIAGSVAVPELPGETRGVHRSGRVARMLPVEALQLRHPRLRLAWHARRAERALLAFEDDERIGATAFDAKPIWHEHRRPVPRRESGPMLVCVDTSGSMRGGAESVAKAVVLECARVAMAQRRPCHVFAFGGEAEIMEITVGGARSDWPALIEFLASGFHGGTDICGPIECVLTRLQSAEWRLADLLLATDGEFGATPQLAARLESARSDLGLRVQGVLIGDRETIGLLELCDDIHWIRDWRRFGGASSASPVHSSSLTAEYFPGALRGTGQRSVTVAGGEAARVLRGAALEGRAPGEGGVT